MGMKISRFGKLQDGREAHLVTLANANGMTIEVTDYGATLVSAVVPAKDGTCADVVLGYADVTDYAKNGAFISGRFMRNV